MSTSRRPAGSTLSSSKVRSAFSSSSLVELASLTHFCAGLALVGATWESSRLAVNDGSAVRLEASSISWKPKQRDTPSPPAGYKMMSVPCFLDSTRADVLLNVEVPVETTNSTMVIQRAVALVAALD